MAQINLLPWREQVREVKKKNFFVSLVVTIAITLFVIVLFHIYYDDLISSQQQRNDFLKTQISQMQLKVNELRKDKKLQDKIEADLQFLFGLRRQSYYTVLLFNELLKIVPDAITLNKLQRKDSTIQIKGKAQSELAITAFLKKISQDPLFYEPILTNINAAPAEEGITERYFQVEVKQKE